MSETHGQFEFTKRFGLGDYATMQVVNAVNCQILVEIINGQGGEVHLPPGFRDRVGNPTHIMGTRFEDDGRYRLWTEPITPEWNHPGVGTRWERMTGPKRAADVLELYEVESLAQYATMRKIDPETGEDIAGALRLSVQADYLRRGIGGWRRWRPPKDVITELAGS